MHPKPQIVTNQGYHTRATKILRKLHWLPVKYRCIFKLATLVYKYLDNGTPSFFGPTLQPYTCSYNTHCGNINNRILVVLQFCHSTHKLKKHFNNSLAFDAPTMWNALPDNVRTAPSLATFRKILKTYLFDLAFPP